MISPKCTQRPTHTYAIMKMNDWAKEAICSNRKFQRKKTNGRKSEMKWKTLKYRAHEKLFPPLNIPKVFGRWLLVKNKQLVQNCPRNCSRSWQILLFAMYANPSRTKFELQKKKKKVKNWASHNFRANCVYALLQ